jgi:exodeoxyribonuclease VII large subunit
MYALLAEHRQRLDDLAEHLESAQRTRLDILKNRLALAESGLDSVSPLATLSRGYSIARSPDGRLILSAEDVAPGNVVELILADGKLKCKVLEKMQK